MNRTVTTQAEFEEAVAASDYPILAGSGEFTVPAECAELAVEESSQPRIVTWGSSQPRIVTWESSQPRIVTWESSQPRIETWGSSQPRIVTRGSSQPRIETWGSSQLQIRSDHPLTVTAHGRRAVVTHNKHVTVDGDGVDLLVDEPTEPGAWCEHYGLDVDDDGTVVLFKRVNDEFRSSYNGGLLYAPGETVTAADWNTRPVCGGGLHLSSHPSLTWRYSQGERLVAVRVAVADLVPIPSWDMDDPDKCKAKSCVVLHECDEDGEPLPVAEQVTS
jgi:hypothetical protein